MSDAHKPLDLISATMVVAASMIGVGVYTTSGYTLAALGSPTRVLWAWIIGGVIAICGSIGYATLASRFTESGGEYLFLARSLHPVAGMMAGWVSLLAGFTGAIAAAAIGLEEYSRQIFAIDGSWVPTKSIAIGAVLLTAIVHTVGVRRAARLQDMIVALKLLLIAGFVFYSLSLLGQASVAEQASVTGQAGVAGQGSVELSASFVQVDATPMSLLAFANQLVWISLSFAGFNAAVYISGEIRDAKRNVPRAMIGGTILVTVIYIVLNAIFVFATQPDLITGQSQVATLAAEAIGGLTFARFVGGVIVLSLLTSVSALVMTGPRVYAKMADDGLFPAWFQFSDRPPTLAIWFQASLAVIAIMVSSLTELIGYLGLTLSVSSALTVTMVFVLRLRGQVTRLPFWGIPPLVYIVATLSVAVLSAIADPKQAIAALVTLALGIVFYPLVSRRFS